MLLALPLLLLPLPQQDAAPQGPAALHCRLLDEAGAPAAGQIVRMQAQAGEEVYGMFMTAGEDGALRLELPDFHRRFRCTRLTIVPVQAVGELGQWHRALTVDPPAEQAGLDLDLGALRLSSAPVLYAGQVVDDTGAGVAGATVTVEAAKFVTSDPGVPLYETLQMSQVADAEGRFTIRGRAGHSPQEGALGVRVDAPGHLPLEHRILEPGADALRLEVVRAGSVEVSWVLPEGLEGAMLRVRLERMDEEAAGDDPLVMPWHGDLLSLPTVRPGLYRVSVEDEVGNPVHVADGVEVVAGEPCGDPRLSAIDLRHRLRVQRLQIFDLNGKPLPRPPTVWTPVDRPEPARRAGRAIDRESWRIAVAAEAEVDLLVIANGYRPQQLHGVLGDFEVRLQPSLVINLKVVDAPELQRGTRTLTLGMVAYPEPEDTSVFRPGYTVVVERGGPVRTRELRALLPGPGQYLVRWAVHEKGPDGRPVFLGRVDGDLLDVPDTLDTPIYETPLPPEVWTIGAAEADPARGATGPQEGEETGKKD